ncbi:MAG: LytTR family DNA-binding domain-containing protein [Defluviitaleaceae bacterium]|nr:LytTR family DNA-binding domain-containing protein [Defluviitaleaceae bacterium]
MDINIAICDDEKHQRDYMVHLVKTWAKENSIMANIDPFESAEQYKIMREENAPHHVLLLDIQMGGQDGVALAKELRAANEKQAIIFVTGVPDFLQEGYDVSALHYLMKPVNEGKLFSVLDKAATQSSKTEPQILLPVDGEMVKVLVRDIMYIESFAHYLEIALQTVTLSVKMPTYKLEQQLGEGFVRCHRSYLVGMRHISKITKTDILLDNGKAIPISRRLYGAVGEAFTAFVSGK